MVGPFLSYPLCYNGAKKLKLETHNRPAGAAKPKLNREWTPICSAGKKAQTRKPRERSNAPYDLRFPAAMYPIRVHSCPFVVCRDDPALLHPAKCNFVKFPVM